MTASNFAGVFFCIRWMCNEASPVGQLIAMSFTAAFVCLRQFAVLSDVIRQMSKRSE